MKTMSCKQLGGACEQKFSANTFEELARMSKKHGMEMYQKGDRPHLAAMQEMQKLMGSPDAMSEWMNSRKAEFNALAED
jgi:hypothetical protein